MFTVCPKCALTLVVTAADLRVAQGYVRCGRCSSVFNALARLTDERYAAEEAGEAEQAPRAPAEQSAPAHSPQGAAQAEPPAEPEAALLPSEEGGPAPHAAAGSSPAAADAVAEDVIPEEALEFDPQKTDVTAVFIEPTPDPDWTAATGSFKALSAAKEPAEELFDSHTEVEIDMDFLASMLHGEAAPAEPLPEDAPHSRAQAQPASPKPGEPPLGAAGGAPSTVRAMSAARAAPASAPQRYGAPHTRPPVEASVAPAHSALHPAPAPGDLAPDTGNRTADDPDGGTLVRSRRYLWSTATACAVLVLLAQILHHYRDDLAVIAPLNRPLSALYASLGTPLVPRWDLHAYDVRQLGASVDPTSDGIITVRASIKNAAPQPQPLPLLRVTLQDRFGNRIASSDVAPRGYLPHALAASALLGGGQRVDAEMGFVDPGANAVGFEIDACLPARGGGVACANDASLR